MLSFAEKIKNLQIGESKFSFLTRGGMLTKWERQGKAIIPTFHRKKGSTSWRGGIPVCFPFFNASPSGMEDIPQHGWLRQEEMVGRITRQTDSEIEVVFEKKNKPRVSYPWLLDYSLTYYLSERELKMTFTVRRLADGIKNPAPINPAFHPYFAVDKKYPVVLGGQRPSFGEEFYYLPIPSKKSPAVLVDTVAGKVQMTTAGFQVFCLWTDNPEKYICLEPVVQEHQKFNTKEGVFLSEGKKKSVEMVLTIIN